MVMSEAIKLYDEKEIRQEKRSADEVIMRRALPEDTEAICQIIQQESVYKDTLQYPYRQTEHKRKRLAEFTDHAIFLVAVLEGSVIGEVGVNIEKILAVLMQVIFLLFWMRITVLWVLQTRC